MSKYGRFDPYKTEKDRRHFESRMELLSANKQIKHGLDILSDPKTKAIASWKLSQNSKRSKSVTLPKFNLKPLEPGYD